MKHQEIIKHIVNWLNQYSTNSKTEGFVIGISGGIDSALTSTLCALTGKKVICLNMPIRQHQTEYDRGNEHIEWLKKNYPNVSSAEVNLKSIFEEMENTYDKNIQDFYEEFN
jgi:NAD+ synthase